MTYNDLWRPLAQLYDDGEAKAIVRLLLSDGFGLTLNDVVCGAVEELPPDKAHALQRLHQRLLTGEPVQYVLGQAEFCGRRFEVRPGVLIPRPETEELCRRMVSLVQPPTSNLQLQTSNFKPQTSNINVLDVGTGSGCIAVTLALELPAATVTAWDLSDEALDVARTNARLLGAEVCFAKQDALAPPDDKGLWDVIVSNPPYICRREQAAMHSNVLEHEPHTALFVPDDDPLLFYRAIAHYGLKALRPGGWLAFELNPLHAGGVRNLLTALGYAEVSMADDAYGRTRFAFARYAL